MALLGQASGGFTESSSALRILHVGVRNTIGQLTADSFTQVNPPNPNGLAPATSTQAPGLLTSVFGVLSGSIAFTRGDEGASFHGGPTASAGRDHTERVLGVYINNAVGNAFENQPGVASNRGPYVSAQGAYGNSLYETRDIDGGGALTTAYAPGVSLVASANGYLTTSVDVAHDHTDDTVIGIVTIAPDSNNDELVYDQRI